MQDTIRSGRRTSRLSCQAFHDQKLKKNLRNQQLVLCCITKSSNYWHNLWRWTRWPTSKSKLCELFFFILCLSIDITSILTHYSIHAGEKYLEKVRYVWICCWTATFSVKQVFVGGMFAMFWRNINTFWDTLVRWIVYKGIWWILPLLGILGWRTADWGFS